MKRKTARPKAKAVQDAVAVPPRFQAFADAFARRAGVAVEKGWGAGNVVLKVRKKIFAMFMGDDIVLKLPKSRVDQLVAQRAGKPFDPRHDGRLMKEWLVLPAHDRWVDLAGEAHAFVAKGAAK